MYWTTYAYGWKINKQKVVKKYRAYRNPDNIDLTLHMGPYENERREVYDSSDEDE